MSTTVVIEQAMVPRVYLDRNRASDIRDQVMDIARRAGVSIVFDLDATGPTLQRFTVRLEGPPSGIAQVRPVLLGTSEVL